MEGFRVGDYVFVNPSAIIDCNPITWREVQKQPYGQIKGVMGESADLPASEVVYSIEFPAPFAGGTNCYGDCQNGHGQFITAKHLDLDFERSRDVITVPKVEGYEEERETNP